MIWVKKNAFCGTTNIVRGRMWRRLIIYVTFVVIGAVVSAVIGYYVEKQTSPP